MGCGRADEVGAASGDPPASAQPAAAASDEPRYDGLTLPEWRERIKQLRFDDPSVADVVPGLIHIVRDRDVPWYTRRQAALTLGRIGEPARDAVPVLVNLLNEDPDTEGETTQFWAVKALALFGPVAREATPALIDVLRSEAQPDVVRLVTLEALGRIGPADPRTLPAVIETLQLPAAEDEQAEAERMERRVAAAEVLELFRGYAASAAPALMVACTDESELLRRAAVKTLGRIGPAAEPALPTLIDRLLFDESEDVRDLAAQSMAAIGPAAEPYLRQLLRDPELDIRWRAADALGRLSRADPSTLDALTAALADDAPRVRLLAAEALWNLTGDSAPVIDTIVAELGHPDREARMQSVRILERIGPTAEFDRDDLQSLIETGDAGTRQAASRILRSWDTPAPGDAPGP